MSCTAEFQDPLPCLQSSSSEHPEAGPRSWNVGGLPEPRFLLAPTKPEHWPCYRQAEPPAAAEWPPSCFLCPRHLEDICFSHRPLAQGSLGNVLIFFLTSDALSSDNPQPKIKITGPWKDSPAILLSHLSTHPCIRPILSTHFSSAGHQMTSSSPAPTTDMPQRASQYVPSYVYCVYVAISLGHMLGRELLNHKACVCLI